MRHTHGGGRCRVHDCCDSDKSVAAGVRLKFGRRVHPSIGHTPDFIAWTFTPLSFRPFPPNDTFRRIAVKKRLGWFRVLVSVGLGEMMVVCVEMMMKCYGVNIVIYLFS